MFVNLVIIIVNGDPVQYYMYIECTHVYDSS